MALWLFAIAACAYAEGIANMNGEYVIANLNPRSPTPFSTSFASRGAEYFDVYSPPIQTVYGEVFW
jgi:hypothetical protein